MSTETDACAAGAVAVAEALRTACTNPADAIRLLSNLAQFFPTIPPGSAPIGQAMATTQTAMAALCRRAALTSLARAISTYQPTSYNDAQTILVSACALFDAEIEVAGDAIDGQSYLALRALRSAIVQDMTTRGSALPQVVTVTRPAALPALALAYQLYADATRTDDLITRANPIHPAFMPTSFEALSF